MIDVTAPNVSIVQVNGLDYWRIPEIEPF
jgi:hypothetical protein